MTHKLKASTVAAQVLDVLSASVLEMGFEYCAFGVRWPLPLTQPTMFVVSNYADEWKLLYAERNYIACDPTVAHGLVSQAPLVWSDEVFADAPALWSEAREHGLLAGVSQSAFSAMGAAGLLSVGRSHEPIGSAELRQRRASLWWLAQAGLEAMIGVTDAGGPNTGSICLTAREVEILRWSADGKTAGDIAAIIDISERTVGFHINNALLKLGTANKTAGVAKAALLHLL